MTSITTHVIPTDEGWIVRRGIRPNSTKPPVGVFATQQKALKVAREIVEGSLSAEILVYGRDGSMRWGEIHGLPPRQKLPHKSKIGTKAIRAAVEAVVREMRLAEK